MSVNIFILFYIKCKSQKPYLRKLKGDSRATEMQLFLCISRYWSFISCPIARTYRIGKGKSTAALCQISQLTSLQPHTKNRHIFRGQLHLFRMSIGLKNITPARNILYLFIGLMPLITLRKS